MVKLRNQQNQLLCLVYSNKGHLVFLYYPAPNTRGITDVCYYTSEISYNARVLNSIVENLLVDYESTREWLQKSQLTLKFSTAGQGFIYIILNHENIFIKSLTSDGQEQYTFVHQVSVPILCSIADYLSCWKIASVLVDINNSVARKNRRAQQPTQQQFIQQPTNSPMNQPMNQYPMNQQFSNFPTPDEIG